MQREPVEASNEQQSDWRMSAHAYGWCADSPAPLAGTKQDGSLQQQECARRPSPRLAQSAGPCCVLNCGCAGRACATLRTAVCESDPVNTPQGHFAYSEQRAFTPSNAVEIVQFASANDC